MALKLLSIAGLANGAFNFLVIGDWGGINVPPYTMPGQVAVAKAMGDVGKEVNSQFVLALGDNFYLTGIGGTSDSPRFKDTFENVYSAPSLQTPWYAIAGNHDHIGNVSAQIEYTKKSKRWNFPNDYFAFSSSFQDAGKKFVMDFIMIDTVTLAGQSHYMEDGEEILLKGDNYTGPADRLKAEEQWEWIEERLANSTANYLWVGGHYPVWSVCEHGPTSYLQRLRTLLEKYNATGYMSGHDHCLEYIDEGRGPIYPLIGASNTCCYPDSARDKVPADAVKYVLSGFHLRIDGGFADVQTDATGVLLHYRDQHGNILYTSPKKAPRR